MTYTTSEKVTLGLLIWFAEFFVTIMLSLAVGFITQNAGLGFLTCAILVIVQVVLLLLAYGKTKKREEEQEIIDAMNFDDTYGGIGGTD